MVNVDMGWMKKASATPGVPVLRLEDESGSAVLMMMPSKVAAQFAAEAINKALELSNEPAPYRLEDAE